MKLHHKSKRTLHFQKGDVCPFCDAAEESLKHSYSAYEKKAYKVICVQTEEKNLSQSVSY